LGVAPIMAAMPHLTEIVGPGDHQVHMILAVGRHHPRMSGKAHVCSKRLTGIRPVGI